VTHDIKDVLKDEDYQAHIETLGIGVCLSCQFPTADYAPLCDDCDTADKEDWAVHREEVENTHAVSVGRG